VNKVECILEIQNMASFRELIIKVQIKIRISWAGHVVRMEERKGVYRDLVGKPEGKGQLGRNRHSW
jgi:hypothetical protein